MLISAWRTQTAKDEDLPTQDVLKEEEFHMLLSLPRPISVISISASVRFASPAFANVHCLSEILNGPLQPIPNAGRDDDDVEIIEDPTINLDEATTHTMSVSAVLDDAASISTMVVNNNDTVVLHAGTSNNSESYPENPNLTVLVVDEERSVTISQPGPSRFSGPDLRKCGRCGRVGHLRRDCQFQKVPNRLKMTREQLTQANRHRSGVKVREKKARRDFLSLGTRRQRL
ncbi:unnamed protein product [Allacma fusca]|uniref:CCHC-type domain-containing protein n=1 Tax=Allacma fusca TaxID=39272 RepID=A0A8J2PQC7_9HEXA|nr:unnamed protein product [Allacma fusca]